jgi:hypothetical protein
VLKASTDGSGTACFGRPVTKKFTTIDEWNEAFAIYMVTYLNKPTTAAETQLLAQELCTYQRDVNNLHKDGLPWYDYDRRFRQDRETTQYSFASIRHDLMLNATMSRTNRYQNPKPNQPFRGTKPLDNQKKPSGPSTTPGGYCFTFNTPGQRCQRADCRFKHNCSSCGSRHPTYLCGLSRPTATPSAPSAYNHQQPLRPSPPAPPQQQTGGNPNKAKQVRAPSN